MKSKVSKQKKLTRIMCIFLAAIMLASLVFVVIQ